MTAADLLDQVIPIEHVVSTARHIIAEAGWKLEFEEGVTSEIPRDVELRVASRAFVAEDLQGYTWGDHYQAKVLVGLDCDGPSVSAQYGVLALYFSCSGAMIAEDLFKC